ncbi:unnamed protein product [Closterium sp. NIES-54]
MIATHVLMLSKNTPYTFSSSFSPFWLILSQFIGSLQTKYNIGSFDLLSQTAPIQAASLVVLGPFVDYFVTNLNIIEYTLTAGCTVSSTYRRCSAFPILSFFSHGPPRIVSPFPASKFLQVILFIVLSSVESTLSAHAPSPETLQAFIILSCLLAVVCNLSQYLCIGKFSATSFQVLGHMKTVLVLVLGFILFSSPITMKNVMGMLMAVVGMVLYSWAVEKGKKDKEGKETGMVKTAQPSPRGSDGNVSGGEEERAGLLATGRAGEEDLESGKQG